MDSTAIQYRNKFLIISIVSLIFNCNQSKKTDNTPLLGILWANSTSLSTSTSLTVTSSAGASGSEMGITYACALYGGSAYNPDLAWKGAPASTKEFALLMTTQANDGLKYNWVLYGIPSSSTSLAKNSTNVGTAGQGSDGPTFGYQAPCSSGPGKKDYIFTIYALSNSPTFSSGVTVTGSVLSTAMSNITLASGSITLSITR